jgi:predicted transcriptional regulator
MLLELLTQGLSNAEMAEKLGISTKTVSNNISNILLNLQATDRTKLMLMALEAGIGHKESNKRIESSILVVLGRNSFFKTTGCPG